MDAALERLKHIEPYIEQILRTAGNVGLSYGIIHHGRLLHTGNFGYRDWKAREPPNEQTMYPICSMTKGLVSSLMGIVIDEHSTKLSWSSPVYRILPDYKRESDLNANAASTLLDWMSMQSGAASYQPWLQSWNNLLFRKEDSFAVLNGLKQVRGVRSAFAYNNWGYEVAAQVIARVTGSSWDILLRERIFEPLKLSRTDASGDLDKFDNVTKAYNVLDDCSPVEIPIQKVSGKTLGGAAGGVTSCISDLLELYHELLKASTIQFQTGNPTSEGSIFKQLNQTMSAHIPVPGPSQHESSYALGWYRTQLPNILTRFSPNHDLLGEEPYLGTQSQPRLVIGHGGNMPGAYTGVTLFPETESVIVLLSNTLTMCDMSDWIMQILIQTLFDLSPTHDYLEWTKRTIKAELSWHNSIYEELESKRKKGTSPKDLHSYVGSYTNEMGIFNIDIFLQGQSLYLSFQGRDDEVFELNHYESDTFCWLRPRNDLASRGRMVLQSAGYYLFEFCEDDEAKINRFRWPHNPDVKDGEYFIRTAPSLRTRSELNQ